MAGGDPSLAKWDSYAGAAYRETGRFPEALAEYGRVQQMWGEPPLFGYAITYARMGKRTEASQILSKLQTYGRGHYVNPVTVAAIYANLSEKDSAFAWLDRTIQDRTVFLLAIATWPEFDPLRSDPRFAQLLRRIGLPSR